MEELGTFEKRFLRGNTRAGGGRWEEEVGRWLGVRWAAKEALYKAYPYPYRWPWEGKGGPRGIKAKRAGEGEGEGEGGELGGRLTWKEATMRVDVVSGKFSWFVGLLGGG